MNRSWPERMFDLMSATTVFTWGAVSLYRHRIADGLTWPLAWLIGLNVVVAFLFCYRRRLLLIGGWGDALVVGPSVVSGAILLTRTPEFSEWPHALTVLFGAATCGAIVSLLWLGEGFGIFPAVRQLADRGPYRIVRHPVYAFEMLMLAAVAATRGDLMNIVVMSVGVIATVGRVLLEERVLDLAVDFAAYRRRVRWRLLPFVW